MTGRRISELEPAATPLTLGEVMPLVQDGATRSLTLDRVRGGRIVSVRDFGALGDGVADDTAAFRALNARLRADQDRDPDLRAVILIPPGHYRYTWNRWLWGLRHVTVEGYGARLQCVASSPWNLEKFALVTNRNGFQTIALDEEVQPQTVNDGSLIETARPGAMTVRLKDRAAAPRYKPGRYALVMSYDQQFAGYPPNCRHFDTVKVTAVDGAALTLDRPLRHEHRDDYPELTEDSMGRARIVDIDREDVPFALRQTLLGLTFLPNPNIGEDSAQYLLAQGVFSFTARDCALAAFVPSIGHDFTIENTTIAYCEPDKLIESLTLSGCRVGALTQATGVNLLSLRNSTFSRKVNAQARVIAFDGCSFEGCARPGEYQRGVDMVGFAPIKALSILNSVFYGKGESTDAAVGPVETPANGFTSIPLAPPIRILGGVLAIPRTDKRAQTLLRSAALGDILWLGGQKGGDVFCDGRQGRLEAVRMEGSDVLVELSLTAPVVAADILIVPRAQRFRCLGNTYGSLSTAAPVTCDTTFEDAVEHSERYRFRFASDFAQHTRSVCGLVEAITVDVLRPYTGSDVGAFLRIEQRYPPDDAFLHAIDLRQPGRRSLRLGDPTIARESDSPGELGPRRFLWSVRLSHAQTPNGRSAVPGGAGFELADTLVTFRTQNPFLSTG